MKAKKSMKSGKIALILAVVIPLILVVGAVLLIPRNNQQPPAPTTTMEVAGKPVAMELAESIDEAEATEEATSVPTPDPPVEGESPAVVEEDEVADGGEIPIKVYESITSMTVEGRVTDKASGDPIEGVRIGRSESFTDPSVFLSHGISFTNMEKQITSTDEEGRYSLTIHFYDEQAFRTIIRTEKEGYAQEAFLLDYSEDTLVRDLQLVRGVQVTGRLQFVDGSPVADVRMFFMRQMEDRREMSVSSISTKSESDGSFVADGFEEGVVYRLNLTHEYTIRGESTTIGGASDVIFTLTDRSLQLHGMVLDAGGKPVPNAVVTYGVREARPGQQERKVITTRADREGRWELYVGPEDTQSHVISAHVENPPEGSFHTIAQHFTFRFGERQELNLQLPASYQIHGRVVIEGTDKGLAGVHFNSAPLSGIRSTFSDEPDAISDSDGNFRFMIPLVMHQTRYSYRAPEGYQVRLETMRNYVTSSSVHISHTLDNEPILLKARPTGELTIRLLRSEGGETIPNARVSLSGTSDVTNEEGLVTLNVVMEGTTFVSVLTEGQQTNRNFSINLGEIAPDEIYDLIVADVASMGIQLYGPTPEEMVKIQAGIRPVDQPHGAQNRVSFNEKGYLLYENIEPEIPQRVVLHIPNDVPWKSMETIDVTLEPGEFFDTLEIELEPRGVLEVRVRNLAGNPVESFSIWSSFRHGHNTQSRSDHINNTGGIGYIQVPDGNRILERVAVSAHGYLRVEQTFTETPEGPLEFTLEPAIEVVVEVVEGETGEAARDFHYTIGRGQAGSTSGRQHRGAGPVVSHVQEPGEYIVSAWIGSLGTANHRRGEAALTVGEGDTHVSVQVVLKPSGTLRGKVHSKDDDAGLEGVKLLITSFTIESNPGILHNLDQRVFPGQERNFVRATTDAEGKYEVTGLALDTAQYIMVEKDGYQTIRDKEFRIDSRSGELDLDIAMEPGRRVYGKVIGPDGNPVMGTTVTVSHFNVQGSHGNVSQSTKTDEEGRYEMRMNEPGRFSTTAMYRHARMANQMLFPNPEEDSNEDFEINFDMSPYVYLEGQVTINGEPWSRTFTGNDQMRANFWIKRKSDNLHAHGPAIIQGELGRYAMLIRPGTHLVDVDMMSIPSGRVPHKEIEIDSSPDHQELDLDLVLSRIDIGLVFPSPRDFVRGRVTLHNVTNPTDPPPTVNASSEEVLVPNLQPGTWKFTFQSEDRLWYGESDEVEITMGENGVLLIDVYRESRLIRIGGWSPAIVSDEYSPVEFDITPHLESADKVTVIFNYESGADALMISLVRLLRNDMAIFSNSQNGWAGTTHRLNSYLFHVKQILEPESTYSIRAHIRAGNTMDSTGSVYLLVE